jgi:hypothetical protein
MTEQEMRESEVKKVTTIEELSSYIAELVNQNHDYGTCVYAMSMSAVATFYYVAHKLGVTGFQACCADWDFLRRTRRMDKFKILDLENLLFPQYQDEFKSYEELIKENKSWLSKEAEKRLAANPNAHPAVIKHWKELATTNKEEQ